MFVLVTGGSGYFGSLLVRALLAQGDSVRVFDLEDAEDRPPGVELVRGDIRDPASVAKACKGISVVYHNVAQVPLANNRHLFDSVNVQGTANLLSSALAEGIKKVIHTSSSAIFGAPKENPVTGQTVPRPFEAYGKAKYEAELVCGEYVEKGLDITIIRPRTILGHGRMGIFQILFEWIRTGFNVPVLGKGNSIYQFVHAGDLANACIAAARRQGASVYNCGTDRYGTMRQALEALCEHAGTGSRVRSVPMMPAILGMRLANFFGIAPLRAYHALMYGRSLYFDITKAQTELNWQPKYSNEEMLIESYESYLANPKKLSGFSAPGYHRSPVKQGVLNVVKWCL